jgi:uncharacterized SAM-binding protein YcdF (DUF218 family)
MFYISSKLLAFLIQPIIWVFILLVIAIFYKSQRKKILIISISVFYFFSSSFIADEFTRLWEVERFTPSLTYDVGIVLGGIADYDKITKTHNFNKNADRLMDAEQLYHKGIIRKIMLSGGNGLLFNDGYIESEAMRDYLLANKIPITDIIIENNSRNTIENAINSAEILKEKYTKGTFLLITSANHMRRAQLCFNKANLEVTAFPTDCTTSYRSTGYDYLLLPRVEALERWQDLIHEWIGYIVYKIKF